MSREYKLSEKVAYAGTVASVVKDRFVKAAQPLYFRGLFFNAGAYVRAEYISGRTDAVKDVLKEADERFDKAEKKEEVPKKSATKEKKSTGWF